MWWANGLPPISFTWRDLTLLLHRRESTMESYRQASRPLSCLPAQSPTRWPWPPPRGYGGHGHSPSPLLRRTCLFLAQLTRRCPLPHGHCPNANLFTCCNNHKFSVGDEGVSLTHAMAEGLTMARNRKVAVAIIAIASSIHWR